MVNKMRNLLYLKVLIVIVLLFSTQICKLCFAYEQMPNWEKLANAIYKAEGGAKTAHPYGILTRYKHTTPRQACINTLKSKYREWASNAKIRAHHKEYLTYLASRYAPIGASNDPTGLNNNWLKNVRYFYEK